MMTTMTEGNENMVLLRAKDKPRPLASREEIVPFGAFDFTVLLLPFEGEDEVASTAAAEVAETVDGLLVPFCPGLVPPVLTSRSAFAPKLMRRPKGVVWEAPGSSSMADSSIASLALET